jgi:hypothetical protein
VVIRARALYPSTTRFAGGPPPLLGEDFSRQTGSAGYPPPPQCGAAGPPPHSAHS